MSETVSPLDNQYARLGQVALLMSRNGEQCAADDIMDLFKCALFSGEFDPPPLSTRARPDNPVEWLHMEIEVPRHTVPPEHATLRPRPKQVYGVNRETVASVLFTTDALPGGIAHWSPLFERIPPHYEHDRAMLALAAIPFRDYPEHGRREIEALIIPKAKLSTWLATWGTRIPAFLANAVPAEHSTNESDPVAAERGARPQGRPHKPAWPRVVQLVRQLHNDHPDWQKKRLAFEAWQLARHEFTESELPSVATIQRSMVEILGSGSG